MKNLFLAIAAFICLPLFSQTSINGIIYDKQSNESLVGANVYIENSFFASFSDVETWLCSYLIDVLLEDLVCDFLSQS